MTMKGILCCSVHKFNSMKQTISSQTLICPVTSALKLSSFLSFESSISSSAIHMRACRTFEMIAIKLAVAASKATYSYVQLIAEIAEFTALAISLQPVSLFADCLDY